ncbi:uncharacterized protein METZ01_LOCUS287638 [marine metagenome]|uniref:SET domain-containing protein n=1 Tax=marine metagenome TaxID=408172 RepID=A0A382LD25_9ZZZZ
MPDCLTIQKSEIHGLGLFATEDIPEGTNLGIAHVLIPHAEETFSQSYCRTPLGGFYNHSNTPNCEIKSNIKYFYNPASHHRLVTTIMELFTKKEIKEGQEITSNYILYKIDEIDEKT